MRVVQGSLHGVHGVQENDLCEGHSVRDTEVSVVLDHRMG
jgi:hypothetical protein